MPKGRGDLFVAAALPPPRLGLRTVRYGRFV